jgi:hypothetical protein
MTQVYHAISGQLQVKNSSLEAEIQCGSLA